MGKHVFLNYEADIEEHSFRDMGGNVLSISHSLIFYRITDSGERVEVSAGDIPSEVALHFELQAEKAMYRGASNA